MQLFLSLNDLAGRWPWVDELFRLVYVGTVPLLATLLLASLTLFPRSSGDASRSRIVLAALSAVVLCVFTMVAINLLASVLHLGVLSPRPFMTRRVNLLVVEPQDNSFPSPEMMVAAALATILGLTERRLALPAFVLAFLLGTARLFCGNNYGADVLVGAVIGVAWSNFTLALAQVRVRGLRHRTHLSGASALLGATVLSIYVGLALQPRFAAKLYLPWGSPALAAPPHQTPVTAQTTREAQSYSEGEGVAEGEGGEDKAEALALSKRSNLYLPQVEAYLRVQLTPYARPFELLDVEVAPVKAGTSSYRCAAVRFEVKPGGANLRQQVAACAARMVRLCFRLDRNLQNVDVVAIVRGNGKTIDGSEVNFVGDEVPVFTASIQRKNLVLRPPAPAWANLPNLPDGTWLRFRSLLFVNAKILPENPNRPNGTVAQPPSLTPRPTPTPTATATPRPTPHATPTVTPTPPVKIVPTVVMAPHATPRPIAPTPKVALKVTPRVTPRPFYSRPQWVRPTPAPRRFAPSYRVPMRPTPRPTPGRWIKPTPHPVARSVPRSTAAPGATRPTPANAPHSPVAPRPTPPSMRASGTFRPQAPHNTSPLRTPEAPRLNTSPAGEVAGT